MKGEEGKICKSDKYLIRQKQNLTPRQKKEDVCMRMNGFEVQTELFPFFDIDDIGFDKKTSKIGVGN